MAIDHFPAISLACGQLPEFDLVPPLLQSSSEILVVALLPDDCGVGAWSH